MCGKSVSPLIFSCVLIDAAFSKPPFALKFITLLLVAQMRTNPPPSSSIFNYIREPTPVGRHSCVAAKPLSLT